VVEASLYRLRFSDAELKQQQDYWRPICAFLQQWIKPDGVTLDLGAGYCHFINTIRSAEKLALDLNEENLRKYAGPDVRSIVGDGAKLTDIPASSVDSVFASNVYEHFQSREQVAESFYEVRRVLRPGGHFVIMQPNFAYCQAEYFDFFDHRLIFTHRGMAEGLQIADFSLIEVIARFLPYTSKGRLPKATWLVSLYMKFRPVWSILGAQMLIVARKPD